MDSGIRWGSVRVRWSFSRSGGMTQIRRSKSISLQRAPITSPVRSPVSRVTSSASPQSPGVPGRLGTRALAHNPKPLVGHATAS